MPKRGRLYYPDAGQFTIIAYPEGGLARTGPSVSLAPAFLPAAASLEAIRGGGRPLPPPVPMSNSMTSPMLEPCPAATVFTVHYRSSRGVSLRHKRAVVHRQPWLYGALVSWCHADLSVIRRRRVESSRVGILLKVAFRTFQPFRLYLAASREQEQKTNTENNRKGGP